MAKLTLTDLVSLQNETSVVSAINNNNTKIEAALENTLSRDGTSPNEMEDNLDMNSNRILNLPAPVDPTEPVRKQEYDELAEDVQEVIDEAQAYLIATENARDAALLAESGAVGARIDAEIARDAAQLAEGNAEASELAAAQSAADADASAIQAALNSENPAVGYEFNTGTADSDPGNGFLRFNNANPASATFIYIDNQDRDGNTQTGWIDSFDDSTSAASKGIIVVRQVGSPAAFASFRVSGAVVDGTGYRKIPVSYLSNGGTFANNGVLAVMFGPSGDAGSGDITGPGSSADNRVARFDGTDGKSIQNSTATLDDSGRLTLAYNTDTGNALRVLNYNDASTVIPAAFYSQRATPTDNDIVRVNFVLHNDAGAPEDINFGSLEVVATDVSDGTEDGIFRMRVITNGVDTAKYIFSGASVSPVTNDSATLGTATLSWSDLFLASGGVINWNNGNVVLTHSTGNLNVSTGSLSVGGNAVLNAGTENQGPITGGAAITPKDHGTVTTGTITPTPADRTMHVYINNGPHTLAPASDYGTYTLDIENESSADVITLTGWTKVIGSFTTTDGHLFACTARIGPKGSVLHIEALQ